jgi:hypothetical protein
MFDNTPAWGSQGRLMGVVYHSCGPFDILSHELGHTWMAYLDSLTFSNGGCGVHWAENQTIGGNMSLWPKVVESAPGVFEGIIQDMPDEFNSAFSDLDLYLMGLKPLNDIPLIKRLNNPDYTNPDSVRYSSVTIVDPKTFPAQYGERQPAYPDAQRDFKMATIVIKPLGWTDAEFTYFSLLSKHAADSLDDGFGGNYNFEKAAKGLVTLESKLFTPSGAPSVPVLNSPADGAIGQLISVTFKWDSSQMASYFHLQVSMKNDFTDTLIEKSGIAGTSYNPPGLKKGTTYYWRVRALDSNGMSQFSVPRSFSTFFGIPQTPTLKSPANNTKGMPVNPVLSWNESLEANQYHLQVSLNLEFSIFVINDSMITYTTKSIDSLKNNTIYYWRVRAKNGGGWGAFSVPWQFSTIRTTMVATVGSEIPKRYELCQNYPNPFNPSTTIKFALPISGSVTLKVFDLLGNEIETLISEDLGPGNYTVRWSTKVPSGIYLCRLQAGEFVQTKRMILTK